MLRPLPIAVALMAVLFDTVLAKALSVFEFVILVVHILVCICFEVVLLALGPHG